MTERAIARTVKAYYAKHPEATQDEVVKATGCALNTAKKYYPGKKAAKKPPADADGADFEEQFPDEGNDQDAGDDVDEDPDEPDEPTVVHWRVKL